MFVVTGATGRTGRAVVDELLRNGREVRALGRSARTLEQLRAAGADTAVAEPTDRSALGRAFRGAEGVYLMIQPNYIPDSQDFPAHQARIVEAMVAGLSSAGVRRVVTLSSWGADKESGTGPVVGLHRLEQRVNRLNVSTTHLRAGYFMENLIGQVEHIRAHGVIAAPFDGRSQCRSSPPRTSDAQRLNTSSRRHRLAPAGRRSSSCRASATSA
jgi:uncharacterized protein YbjT (DUF2867 family)